MASQVIQLELKKALAIGGWMSEGELAWLASNARDKKVIVEFGSHHGRSTRVLADNSPDDCKIYAVDPWGGDYRDDEGRLVADINTYVMPYFVRNLKDHIDNGKVIPVRKYSYDFNLPEGQRADMVFIDGDHRLNQCVDDIIHAKLMLKPRGLLCGHDYGHPLWWGVKAALERFHFKVNLWETIWWTTSF